MKCDNFVSPFKHDLCVPGCCHDKLLALLLMESARKVNNERLRCAEVFSQAEYSTTLLSFGYVGTRKDLYVKVVLYNTEMERSTLSVPKASIAQMFVPAVVQNPRHSFQSVMIRRWCQSCGVCSDRSPSCRGLPQGRMHGTRTLHVQESYTTIPWRIWQVQSASTRLCMEQRCWRLQLCPQSC